MENHFVKYSLLKKRMTVKIKDPKKRSMHRIYIHTNRLINGVNQVFSQTGVSYNSLSIRSDVQIHHILSFGDVKFYTCTSIHVSTCTFLNYSKQLFSGTQGWF